MSNNPIEAMFDEENDVVDFEDFLNEEFEEQKQEIKEEIEKEDIDIEELVVKYTYNRDLSDIEQEMVDTIMQADRKSWEREEGLKTRYPILNEKLNGIQPGLGFVAGESNMGKSGFLLDIGYSTSEIDNAYSLYFSIDDSAIDLLPRIIAAKKKIPINSVRLPATYADYPKILERRKEGMKEIYESVDRFKILDSAHGKSIEIIEKAIRRHYNYLKENNIDRKLFVQIDSFHDLDSEDQNFRSDKEKYSYLAGRLNDIAEELDIPIWCTGELRKLGGQRRPIKEDLREANKIIYKAKLILMIYNEVGVEGNGASIFFKTPEKPGKQPIFEVHFSKNKQSQFKGRLYYEFLTDYALYEECLPEDMQRYSELIYSAS